MSYKHIYKILGVQLVSVGRHEDVEINFKLIQSQYQPDVFQHGTNCYNVMEELKKVLCLEDSKDTVGPTKAGFTEWDHDERTERNPSAATDRLPLCKSARRGGVKASA